MLDELYVLARSSAPMAAAEVDAVARDLGFAWPGGYVELVTACGAGIISDRVRVHLPGRVREELAAVRAGWAEREQWDGPDAVLTVEQLVDCVAVADTVDGDEVVVHPQLPGRVFVLPGAFDEVLEVGADLEEAIRWLCGSGVLAPRLGMLWFEPWTDRGLARFEPADRDEVDLDDVVDAVVGLGLHARTLGADEDDAAMRRLFIPTIGGAVTVTRHGDQVAATVGYDTAAADPDALALVDAVLRSCRLAPPA